jgi:hypothetical protein
MELKVRTAFGLPYWLRSWFGFAVLTSLAAMIIIRIPAWLEFRREARAKRTVAQLTPELVLARCGNPVKDAMETLRAVDTEPVPARHLFYRGAMSRTVLLTFVGSSENEDAGTWKLASFKAVIGTNDRAGYLTWQNDQAKIAELPCLSGQ